MSPAVDHLVEIAMEEVRALHHNYIGTEHLLLALVRQDGSKAMESLAAMGVTGPAVRQKVLQLLGHA